MGLPRNPYLRAADGESSASTLKQFLWILGLALILSVLAPSRVYRVVGASSPQNPASEATGAALGDYSPSSIGSILVAAHELVNQSGSRPYWPNLPYSKGEDVPADLAPDVVAHLVACESQCRSVKHMDSNDAYSYGIGQIQSSTWQMFEKKSGLSGDPMSPTSTVPMMLWAAENGYLSKWSCAKLLGIVK